MGRGATTWVESPSIFTGGGPVLLFLAGMAVLVNGLIVVIAGWGAYVSAWELTPVNGTVEPTVLLWITTVFFPVLILLLRFGLAVQWVGLDDSGVILVARVGVRTIPWASLRPPPGIPRGAGCALGYAEVPSLGSGRFWVAKEQARAIVSDVRCPGWLFPREFLAWLGAGELILRAERSSQRWEGLR